MFTQVNLLFINKAGFARYIGTGKMRFYTKKMLTMLAQTEFFTSLVKENTRVKDDYVNATVWSKAFGREWRVYRQSKRCKRTIDNLVKEYHITIRDVVEAKPGKVPETWVHPEIAIDFAEWLSPEFSSFVKRIFIRYLKGDRTLAAEILARDHNRDRVERAKNRLHCSDTNKTTAQLAFAAKKPIAQVHFKTHGDYRAC